MDGFKKRLNQSVQRKLSLTLSLVILVVALAAGIVSAYLAFDEAHELQDDVLRQVAQLMDRQGLPPAAVDAHAVAVDEEARLIVQPLEHGDPAMPGGKRDAALSLPATLADGLHTLTLEGRAYRVLVRTTSQGQRIAVSQAASFRDEIARDSALRTVLPFLVLIPILLLAVADLVRKLFRPIATLSREIDQRAEQALHPVEDQHLPIEVRPFAVAINRLLARVDQSMDSQRRFIADAAHELRTPLAALSLQAERLSEADMPEAARERLAALRHGIERGRNLLDQLLALARAQSAAQSSASAASPISVLAIYRRVLEDLMPLAEARRIDLGVEGTQDARIPSNELDLFALVRNLADNAIRYTPRGGRVDLSVHAAADGSVMLCVQDTGPGIAPAERERVFDPFYRTLGNEQSGSGLGLAIVRTIADRMGAEIQLDYAVAAARSGLRVTVRIPAGGP